MTLDAPALKRMFPRCSAAFIEANAAGVSDSKPQRKRAQALDRSLPAEEESPHRTHVSIVRFARNVLDQDNLTGGAKPCLDCLKEAGLIIDDSMKHIYLVVEQEIVDTEAEERTVIEIIYP